MARYLRDKQVNDLSITLTQLEELAEICAVHAEALRVANPALPDIRVSATVRFDQKGYTIYTLDEFKRIYKNATEIERVHVSIESFDQGGARTDSFLELRLDKFITTGFLTVGFGDENWVNATFSAFDEWLKKRTAWYRVVKTIWTELLIQITGVCLVFLLSLMCAKRISPRLEVENSFLLAFLFVFLLASNVWGFLQKQVHPAVTKMFPNVEFIREGKESSHWVVQGLVLLVLTAVIGTVFSNMGTLLSGELNSLFKAV